MSRFSTPRQYHGDTTSDNLAGEYALDANRPNTIYLPDSSKSPVSPFPRVSTATQTCICIFVVHFGGEEATGATDLVIPA